MRHESRDIASSRQLLTSPVLGRAELSILGGTLAADRLGEFLRAWKLPRDNMPFCLWETIADWVFLHGQIPAADALFERAAFFGPAGDLELRAEGNEVLWHFIGPAGIPAPPEFRVHDFWSQHAETCFRACDSSALLWGQHKGETDDRPLWRDDRVGWARLAYPHAPAERVEISYTLLMEGGQVAFVWWKELCAHA